MTFVQASSTPSTISVRCFSEKGWRDRNLRTKLRINARFAVWLVNSSFPLFIGPNKRRAHLSAQSSADPKLIGHCAKVVVQSRACGKRWPHLRFRLARLGPGTTDRL